MSNIELRNLTYRYAIGGVSNLSFNIAHGKVACLLGPSGSGKSTVLKLIAGFLKPQQGSIFIGDLQVAGEDRFTTPQQRHVGLVFQQHALFPHLSVERNILFGCRNKNKKYRAFIAVIVNNIRLIDTISLN